MISIVWSTTAPHNILIKVTYYFWRGRSVRVWGWVGIATVGIVVAVSRKAFSFGGRAGFPLIDNQVDGHFTLQTADVPVTEIIAELVNL